ncbi:MAG: ribonuclease Y [Rhizobacter sp.]|nr:ribonuclease Y [Chlorobiales bacterium]
MDIVINFLLLIITAVLFFVGGFFAGRYFLEHLGTTMILESEERSRQIVVEAQREGELKKQAKLEEVNEEWKRKKREFEQEITLKNNKFAQTQKQMQIKEDTLTRRTEQVQRREKQLEDQQKDINQKLQFTQQRGEELKSLIAEQNQKLETISALNAEDAKAMLIDNILAKAKEEAAASVKDIHVEAEENAKKIAEKTILMAIERTSLDQSAENAITVVHLQSDEFKGRIIGREGRNIKAFENTTGVDIIVDDTPEVVILSSFDPVRREVAKMALQKLLVDGMIHPAAIEKAVKDAQKELDEHIITAGEETVAQLGIANIHPDILRLIGKMKYRSSYGQNMLKHSREVSMLAGLMAAELKLDTKIAKRAGLLHDIGKVLDTPETSHALAGMEYLRKYKEPQIVLNAVGAHHNEIPKESAIADLIDAANVISGSRPGARGAVTPEGYIKRLESLEEIARGFNGVVKSYALQAGREIRVIVEGDRINDVQADALAHDIAGKIHSTVQYPGQIKITVVRETRAVAYAK